MTPGAPPEIVLNEVLPDVAGDGSVREQVELYNPGKLDIGLEGWSLTVGGRQLARWGASDVLRSGEHLAIAVAPLGGHLGAEASLDLLDASGARVDHLAYGVGGDPANAEIWRGTLDAGQSISRFPDGRATGDLSDDLVAGTPTLGAANAPAAVLLHRWMMTDGGEGTLGEQPFAAANRVRFKRYGPEHFARTSVVDLDDTRVGGALVDTLEAPSAWTLEIWFRVPIDRPADAIVVARVELSRSAEASVVAQRPVEQPAGGGGDFVGVGEVTIIARCGPARDDDELALASGSQTWEPRLEGLDFCGSRNSLRLNRQGTERWQELRLAFRPHPPNDPRNGELALSAAPTAHRPVVRLIVSQNQKKSTVAPGPKDTVAARVDGTDVRALRVRLGVGADPEDNIAPDDVVDIDEISFFSGLQVGAPERDGGPASRGPLPYREPFDHPTFSVRGHYLGLVADASDAGLGQQDAAADLVARHRLVIGAQVQLTRHSQAVVQVRTLESRAIDATGSMTSLPTEGRITSPADFTLSLEQAFVGRNSAHERAPLFLAAGRMPITFGLGIDEQNTMGSIDPPPWSPNALFGETLDDDAGVRNDAYSDRVFQSTLDGLVLGVRDGRQKYDDWVQIRSGRRNSWCAGRHVAAADPLPDLQPEPLGEEPLSACPTDANSTYELSAIASLATRFPGVDDDVLSVDAGGGIRWHALEPVDTGFLRADALYLRPRTGRWWTRFAGEGVYEWVQPITAPDVPAVAVEDRGRTRGFVLQGDLSERDLPYLVLSAAGGASFLAPSGTPTRGLHPDFDVDVVGFEHLIAGITARAFVDSFSPVLPSLGGVYGGSFVRGAVTLRIAGVGEIPIALIGEHNSLEIPSVLQPGWLGKELDLGARIRIAGWRFGLSYGILWTTGPALLEPHYPYTATALRIARNL